MGDIDPSSRGATQSSYSWRNDKAIRYKTNNEYKDDPKPWIPQAARSGPFWYSRGRLRYGTHFDGERAPPSYLRVIFNKRTRVHRSPRWYQDQLSLYGVPFKRKDDKEKVLRDAVRNGLCEEPSQKIKDLERRLATQYQDHVSVFEKTLEEWKERQEAKRKEAETAKEAKENDDKRG